MKKTFLIIQIVLLSLLVKANSQTTATKVLKDYNKLLLLTRGKVIDEKREKLVILSESIYENLDYIKDTFLATELRVSLSNSLISFENRQKQGRIDLLLKKAKSDRKNDMFDYSISKNMYFLKEKIGWNPNRAFSNFQSFTLVLEAINYKFFNEQQINDEFIQKSISIIKLDNNVDSILKENALIKLCSLIKNNEKNIDIKLQTESYDLLESYRNNSDIDIEDLKPSNETQNNAKNTSQLTTSIFAGIEIGSKAVKLSVVELKEVGDTAYTYTQICEPSTKSHITNEKGELNPSIIATQIRDFYDCLFRDYPNEFSAQLDNIFIAYSSGFCKKVKKDSFLKNLDSLVSLFLRNTNKKIIHLNEAEESFYTFIGSIHNKKAQGSSAVIDIGSQNTKGGFFGTLGKPRRNEYKAVYFNLATGSIQEAVDKIAGSEAEIPVYVKNVDEYLRNNRDTIKYGLSRSQGFNNLKRFYFSGGISWVIATYLSPYNYDQSAVPIDELQIQKFIDIITNHYGEVVDKVGNEREEYFRRKRMNGDSKKCLQCEDLSTPFTYFNQKQCIAGAKLLLETIKAIKRSDYPYKKFYVMSSGKLSWLNGLIMDNLY